MSEKTGENGLEYPINQKLLEEATQVREEWRVIKDRLSKIDEHKGQVSDAVHDKVHRDYSERLKGAKESVLEKKNEIDAELKTLYGTRDKISGELDDHHQKLEEIKFRNTLGEFSEEEYQGAAKEEQDILILPNSPMQFAIARSL